MKNSFVFLGFVAAVLSVEVLGGFFTSLGLGEWYSTLSKPQWTPPAWIFGPVWTLLYLLMALAIFLVWQRRDHPLYKTALTLWWVQLFLNFIWSALFFALKSPWMGLIDLTLLTLTVIATMIVFSRISRVAGALMIPYVLWLLYALTLNAAIWFRNG